MDATCDAIILDAADSGSGVDRMGRGAHRGQEETREIGKKRQK